MLKIDIKGFIETSFVDWDGKISSVIFTPGCNFNCPFCHNYELIEEKDYRNYDNVPFENMEKFWKEHSDFIDGVCITGGEPTLHKDLPDLCKKIRKLGLLVKLDTNGSNPEFLKKLIDEKLVDYVAMDIKAPIEEKKYSLLSGAAMSGMLGNIKKSIEIIMASGLDYEFRTTIIPSIHSSEDIEEMAKSLKGAKKYVLQKFQHDHINNEKLSKQHIQSDEEMKGLVELAKKHMDNVSFRGK